MPTDFIVVRLLNKVFSFFLLRIAISPQSLPQRKIPLLEPKGFLAKDGKRLSLRWNKVKDFFTKANSCSSQNVGAASRKLALKNGPWGSI